MSSSALLTVAFIVSAGRKGDSLLQAIKNKDRDQVKVEAFFLGIISAVFITLLLVLR